MKCPLKLIKTISVSNIVRENYDFSDPRQCIAYGEAKAPYNVNTEFGECDKYDCMAYAPNGGREYCKMMPKT